MSSTFSNSLRIELIGSGDQAGAWGTTTNNNLSYILDTAVAGYQTVTITSTSQALTYTNGPASTAAANQAIYAMLKFNGASAATSIFAPPVSKEYILWNNSGYTITIYNSTVIGNTTAAGSGVAIVDGGKVFVWSDGTNFYTLDGVKSVNLSGGTTGLTTSGGPITGTGTITLAGTLATANGGTNNTATPTAGGAAYGTGTAYATTAAGTAGQYLKSNGASAPTWADIPANFPSGTLMLFQQTAAPTGWTKQTTHNDKALRVVSGAASSGGTTAFSTVFTNQTPTITTSGLSAGATTLTLSQIPSHAHSTTFYTPAPSGSSFIGLANLSNPTTVTTTSTTDSQGGGLSHSHPVAGSATSSAVTLNVQYVDLIIASKD